VTASDASSIAGSRKIMWPMSLIVTSKVTQTLKQIARGLKHEVQNPVWASYMAIAKNEQTDIDICII
jgi:hypothetical protein